MDKTFASLKDLLEAKRVENPKPKFKSQRAELFNELYGFYERSYKKNTWEAYRKWLRANKFRHSPERVKQYQKDKSFRKIISVKSFCSYWLSFIKTADLFYLLSIAKDKEKRGENFNQWLFWAIKEKTVV